MKEQHMIWDSEVFYQNWHLCSQHTLLLKHEPLKENFCVVYIYIERERESVCVSVCACFFSFWHYICFTLKDIILAATPDEILAN